jgi:pyrroline-5-carboxylate reductase
MARIGFIGAGNMAEAIARGLLRTASYKHNEISATDPNAERRRLFAEELGIPCADQGGCADAAAADVVLLAVKPFVMAEALTQIKKTLKPQALIISIAAGISTRFIEQGLAGAAPDQARVRVVRVMPNTPMLVGKGVAALCRGAYADEHDLLTAERIFAAGGKTVRVTEDLMDAVTAVSGSGPAYVFYLTECLAAAGVAAGLSETQAGLLARQTIVGSAALLEQSSEAPAELRRKVTTPKGTTQAAIEAFEAGGFAEVIKRGVQAAAQRSKELGK